MSTERHRRYRHKLKCKAFDLIGRSCVFCKSVDNLQLAHVLVTPVKGEGRGSVVRYKDVLANPDSYRPMCRTCHLTFDTLISKRKGTVQDEIPF